ncbi:SPFH domain-containing protein [Curtobacterium citreum]
MGYVLPVLGIVIGAIVLLTVLFGTLFTVQQQTSVIVERFGKFHREVGAGLHIKVPLIDRVAHRVDLRVNELKVKVETKTKDNVFARVRLSVQYRVIPTAVRDAVYSLDNAVGQIESYVFDAVRGKVPSQDLDDVFASKDEIAQYVNENLEHTMREYGYLIVKTLVTDVEPDEKVKESMNAINAARRNAEAASAQGDADKIRIVKAAEAEAEAKRLSGEGVAKQRKAIADGLAESIERVKSSGIDDPKQAADILAFTQYTDMVAAASKHGATTLFIPNTPSGVSDAVAQGNLIADAAKK